MLESGQGSITDTLVSITPETLIPQLMGAPSLQRELWANHIPQHERDTFMQKLQAMICSTSTPLAGASPPSLILTHPHSP